MPRIGGAVDITRSLSNRRAMSAAEVHALAPRDRGRVCYRAAIIVLGAWGCGVFRNDPAEVAAVFAGWLADPRFRGCFDRVVFAVFDRSKDQVNLRPFQAQFTT